jgi:hypothetical protein
MAHSKSSSIVKWIFIVGILELAFWLIINLFVPDSIYQVYEDLNLEKHLKVFMVFHYLVIVVFLYFFYVGHKKISIASSTKNLITRILNIRKTVKNS